MIITNCRNTLIQAVFYEDGNPGNHNEEEGSNGGKLELNVPNESHHREGNDQHCGYLFQSVIRNSTIGSNLQRNQVILGYRSGRVSRLNSSRKLPLLAYIDSVYFYISGVLTTNCAFSETDSTSLMKDFD